MERNLERDLAVGSNHYGDDEVEATMSKKPKTRTMAKPIQVQEVKPRATTYVPPECTMCTELRSNDEKAEGENFTRVYGTVGSVRYCRCAYCGNTWKHSSK